MKSESLLLTSVVVLAIVSFLSLGFMLGEINHDVSALGGMAEQKTVAPVAAPTPAPARR